MTGFALTAESNLRIRLRGRAEAEWWCLLLLASAAGLSADADREDGVDGRYIWVGARDLEPRWGLASH